MSEARAYAFGDFTLDRLERILRRGTQAVPVGERAMDLLLILVEQATEVVSKSELMARAWPATTVDESTLRFHISMLRKVLDDSSPGKRYISSVSGRGYCFVATVAPGRLAAPSTPTPWPSPSRKATRLLGREAVLQELASMLPERRFVTLTGGGGMGKTTVALALAERLGDHYADGVQIVDVTLVGNGAFLAPSLARQLGVPYSPSGVLNALQRWMQERHMLIILDSCEAQLDACATVAQALLEHGPGTHLLCTSREPLRARGEWVLRLPALGLPPPAASAQAMSLAQALSYPALQLLVERAVASKPDFQVSPNDVRTLCELGHRLDGMPLAIELAAVRLDALSLDDLLGQLESRFLLRSQGRRTGADRHRTLEALFDWSHDRLTLAEQTVLRRVSVCASDFSLDAAQAVATDVHLDSAEVVQAIMGLASKSLLSVDMDASIPRYHLLDSTRAYALDKLSHSDELRVTRLRQCTYLCDQLDRAEADWAELAPRQWLQHYALFSHEVREALAWAFGPDGDPEQGVRLVSAAVALGHQLSLSEEYRAHAERALWHLAKMDAADPALELRLSMAQASMLLMRLGPSAETARLYGRALAASQLIGSDDARVKALNGLFVQAYFGDGDYLAAARHSRAVADIAVRASELHLQSLVERLTAQALHGIGRHEESRLMVDSGLRHPPPRQKLRPPFPISQPVMMRALQARILWLQGRPDQAWSVAEELMEMAAQDVRFALPNVLAWTVCPLAMWMGVHQRARACIDRLYHHACDVDMPFAATWACAYDRILARRLNEQPHLPTHEGRLRETCATGVVAELLGTLDMGCVTPALLARSRAGSLGWSEPEILRAQGEQLSAAGQELTVAQRLFERSLRIAGEQGALAWELRTATSLARLWAGQGLRHEAHGLLEPILQRFTEGADTMDLREAQGVLSSLSAGGLNAESAAPHHQTHRDTGTGSRGLRRGR